ncbi:MAG: dihydrolipoamide acetyltransferase component of pyruvate dehydrogenase complex [Chloroflexota bacterium]|nr:MAG: dihydrolipoamide acetyltransferase component of pyruvate dehydrogenase complex [Chloroflexota bacterium]
MAKDVVMPALGMAQETGILLQWLKAPGDTVAKGEPLMEVETDKAAVEVEAPASGVLAQVTAQPGDEIPVGQVIARILTAEEAATETPSPALPLKGGGGIASPVAARMAAEHNLDLSQINPDGNRIQKADVLAYLEAKTNGGQPAAVGGRSLASPKARRLAAEQGLDLAAITGSGPEGAVLAADVEAAKQRSSEEARTRGDEEAKLKETPTFEPKAPYGQPSNLPTLPPSSLPVSRMWQVMAQRLSESWTTVPHFYLAAEVNAAGLVQWRERVLQRATEKITYTDLLVKLVAAALRRHPRLNARWEKNNIVLNEAVNIGLAVAVEEGLLVPVIHEADRLGLNDLARRRQELVGKAQNGKLSLDDLSGGTFTISNLGMYGVDAFNAIVNPPQAAILALGRIAERVVPVNGQPAVQPMLTMTLSCDHRVVDGARGAQFLQTLAELVAEPMRLLD